MTCISSPVVDDTGLPHMGG